MCPLLEVDDLAVSFQTDRGVIDAVNGITFHVAAKETVALVGESGCGKSVTALAILRLLGRSHIEGAIRFGGRDLLTLDETVMRRYRGHSIAYVSQDPLTGLNPIMRIGSQIIEALEHHSELNPKESRAKAIELLETVGIDNPELRMEQYPHQLSGGQRQRVLIAIAIACGPQLLIADEPTTALDVTTQQQILLLLKQLQRKLGMSLLLITHDFGVVAGMSDRVVVLRDGIVVEEGKPEGIYHAPSCAYTRNLVFSDVREHIPQPKRTQSPLLELRRVVKRFPLKRGSHTAVGGVDLTLYQGETLALVGESGCGKSTLAGVMMQLQKATEGTLLYETRPHTRLKPKEMQIIFQNPYSSLNPRMTVRQIVEEPFLIHRLPYTQSTLEELLTSVGLNPSFLKRKPHTLSGGQRQRVSIARALAVEPKLLICDEPLSALDLATQRQIIRLLQKLKAERGLTYLFITHDLGAAQALADRIAVMKEGKIIEETSAEAFFTEPQHPYSQLLLSSVPLRDPQKERQRCELLATKVASFQLCS